MNKGRIGLAAAVCVLAVLLAAGIAARIGSPLTGRFLMADQNTPILIDSSGTPIVLTDRTGRDLFARLIYGGQISLGIGLLAVAVQAAIGIPLGILAGYYRGAVEAVIMRLADIFNSIPNMCLNLVLVTVFSPSFWTIVFVIGITGWPKFGRLIYSSVLSIREKEYVEAARAIGTKNGVIMTKYILPNAISPALVAFTFGVPSAILSESALSFLGLGIQIPLSTWGNMLNGAQNGQVIENYWWRWVFPSLGVDSSGTVHSGHSDQHQPVRRWSA